MVVEHATREGPPPTPAGVWGRVVVIENHAILRQMIVRLLRDIGFEARESATGASGLRVIARVRPDLVVLDLGLSDLPGSEVLARIRADPETAALPVLLLADRDEARAALGEGEQVLPKPFSYVEFVGAVEALVPTGLHVGLFGW